MTLRSAPEEARESLPLSQENDPGDNDEASLICSPSEDILYNQDQPQFAQSTIVSLAVMTFLFVVVMAIQKVLLSDGALSPPGLLNSWGTANSSSSISNNNNNNNDNSCLHNFTSASSWLEFTYRTASRPQSDRCSEAPPKGCQCANPLEPAPASNFISLWKQAFARNLKLVADASNTIFDVVLLGDSITEHWLGTDLGIPNGDYQPNQKVYLYLFAGSNSPVRGLALGIGGDRTGQLLYRLLHGELQVQAKVYWILIGTNDRLGERCHRDVIVAGIWQSVETILAAKPNATVVLSSILPNGDGRLADSHAWHYVQNINAALECYAFSRDRVDFFNATDSFLTADRSAVNATYMASDMLHPSAEGSRVWGQAIVERVQDILFLE